MSDIDGDLEAVVIDNGSWMIKAGYAGDKTARVYERTVIGTEVVGEGNSKDGASMKMFGDRAWFNRNCKLAFPMHRGSVYNWDDMESIWEYIFTKELRDGIGGRPVLMTEVPGNSPENREKMVEIMMEKFRVPALYITDPAGLALISSGQISGIVLDVGGSISHVTAIHHGSLLSNNDTFGETCACRSEIGGDDVTKYLSKIIGKKMNRNFEHGRAMVDIEGLKHCLYNYTMPENKGTDYRFSDGTSISVGEDMINCGDILFNPDKIESNAKGIDKLLCEALHSCEDGVKEELLSNIIISGGTTLTPGVVERLESQIKEEFGSCDREIRVIAPPERRKSSWLGGSIVASLEIFPKICKTREDYTEKGCNDFTAFPGFETFLT